jgi:hypothetical protein
MLKAALVGAIALATIGSSLGFAADERGEPGQQTRSATPGITLTQAQISRFRSVLKLTAAQEQHWPAVEQAFRELSNRQSREESHGVVQGIRSRAAAVGVSAVMLQRLAAAAYPLIQSLDEGQKQSGLALARSMGLESVASAF